MGTIAQHCTLRKTVVMSPILMLLISNNGIPYMNINNNSSITTSSSPRPIVNDATVVDTTKNPIIAAAVGVIGDNGQGSM
jgi:hypothetical protein